MLFAYQFAFIEYTFINKEFFKKLINSRYMNYFFKSISLIFMNVFKFNLKIKLNLYFLFQIAYFEFWRDTH